MVFFVLLTFLNLKHWAQPESFAGPFKQDPPQVQECLHMLAGFSGGPLLVKEKYSYASKFLASLETVTGDPDGFNATTKWSPSFETKLKAQARRFIFQINENASPVLMRLHVLRSRSRELKKESHRVVLAVFYLNGKIPVGFMAKQLVWNARKNEIHAALHGAYFDPHILERRGITPKAQAFFDDNLYRPFGIKQENLKADMMGRYVWAIQGYQFDPRYRILDTEDGAVLNYLEAFRRNFQRFLKFHGISIMDLNISSINDLQEPRDFARVIHKRGIKVTIPIKTTEAEPTVSVELPVGKAFMFSDYRDPKAGKIIAPATGPYSKPFSNRAMLFWNGYRKIDD